MYPSPVRPRLGLRRAIATGAGVLVALILILWATEAVAQIDVIRNALASLAGSTAMTPPSLRRALLGAFLLGGVLGGLIAMLFNLFAAVGWSAPNSATEVVDGLDDPRA